MRRRAASIAPAAAVAAMLAAVAAHVAWSGPPPLRDPRPAGRPPAIRPDYADVVIPPNIAPLNFTVLEPGCWYHVRLRGADGPTIDVSSRGSAIAIPPRLWRRLLEANRGGAIRLDIWVLDEARRWARFEPIRQTVAAEPIDPYLAYRLLRPLYNKYVNVGIYQRHLESFDESPVVLGRTFRNGCVNCHTFLNHRGDTMLVHIRGPATAMLLASNGRVRQAETRTRYTRAPAAYSAWHPSGQFVTFSVNALRQFMHAVGETREVFDGDSDLGCYVVQDHSVRSSRHLTQPERLETFPNWSPDGRHLYFSSAPKAPIAQYRQVRYDLMRVSYESRSKTWGSPERVLSASAMGKSLLEPRVSPDGRFLMFCACPHGSFPIYQPGSDLYLLDLRSGRCERLPVNSDRCDSWHCWSSNGRWFVFSSKRRDGLFAKPYFSYFDAAGRAHRPFLLPQEDPDFYESYLMNYNVPELIDRRIELGPKDFARAALGAGRTVAHAVTGATTLEPETPKTPAP